MIVDNLDIWEKFVLTVTLIIALEIFPTKLTAQHQGVPGNKLLLCSSNNLSSSSKQLKKLLDSKTDQLGYTRNPVTFVFTSTRISLLFQPYCHLKGYPWHRSNRNTPNSDPRFSVSRSSCSVFVWNKHSKKIFFPLR